MLSTATALRLCQGKRALLQGGHRSFCYNTGWPVCSHRDLARGEIHPGAPAIQRYREKSDVKFVKLLDGGMTGNLGLSGFVLELAATKPYQLRTPRQAVNLKRFLFVSSS